MITNIITQVAGQQHPTAVTTIVSCDREGCTNSISFDQTTKEKVLADNPWSRGYRTVQTGDGRSIGYCSDECEVKGAASGKHNIPEAPKIIQQASSAAVANAAKAAELQRNADQALRSGAGGSIQITD